MPIYTAKVGTNADQFPDILELYVPDGQRILDMTYGKGVFWRNVDLSKYTAVFNDIDPNTTAEFSYDFRDLPDDWSDRFDAVVLDPPYQEGNRTEKRGSDLKKALDDRYKVLTDDGVKSVEGIFALRYSPGMLEGQRVLRQGGIMIVKCQDHVESGRNKWIHLWIADFAKEMSMDIVDLFVMVRSGGVPMRHKHQIHARKNHSFWWVFRKE